MLGYLGGQPANTDDWQATGDLGALDEAGFLTIQGRKKHTIVTGLGRNVAPEWLEAEFSTVPGIRQCFVYGDERSGIQALFFAPQAPDDALLQACNGRLPGYVITSYSIHYTKLYDTGKALEYEKQLRHVIDYDS